MSVGIGDNMVDIGEKAKNYKKRLEKMGLTTNPFEIREPPDKETIQKIFTNREDELERIMAVTEGKPNALILGEYGSGKTILLRHLLYQLKDISELNITTIYITLGPGTSASDFINTIAHGVADQFKNECKPAREVYKKIIGVETKKEERGEEGITAKWAGGREKRFIHISGEKITVSLNPAYAKDVIKNILESMSKKYRIIIGVDETDKMNPRDFSKLIAGIRDLLNYKASFIFTGSEAFLMLAGTILSTQYAAFDAKINLSEMSNKHLIEMTKKYCGLAGNCPFTNDVLEYFAEQSMGIPRLMNVLCRGAIETAVRNNLTCITLENSEKILVDIGESLYTPLTPSQKRIVDHFHRVGSEIRSVSKEVREQLGLAQSTIYGYISALINKDVVFERGKNGESFWRLNPAVETYLRTREVTIPSSEKEKSEIIKINHYIEILENKKITAVETKKKILDTIRNLIREMFHYKLTKENKKPIFRLIKILDEEIKNKDVRSKCLDILDLLVWGGDKDIHDAIKHFLPKVEKTYRYLTIDEKRYILKISQRLHNYDPISMQKLIEEGINKWSKEEFNGLYSNIEIDKIIKNFRKKIEKQLWEKRSIAEEQKNKEKIERIDKILERLQGIWF